MNGRAGLRQRPAGPASPVVGAAPIADYATALRASLTGRPDVDDLVDEVVDHLLESAARLQRDGMDPAAAARESVTRFGDRDVVARLYRTTMPGGSAMPTVFTRVAGVAGLLAAAASVVYVAMELMDVVAVFGGDPSGAFGDRAWSLVSVPVLLLFVLLVAGVAARTGALRGWSSLLVVVPLVAAVALGVWAWWALPFWGGLVSLAALAVALRADRRGVGLDGGAVWPLWLLVAAWPLGAVAFFALEPFQLGPVDVHGDHVIAFLAVVLVTFVPLVPAALRLGWWMAREATAARHDTHTLAPA